MFKKQTIYLFFLNFTVIFSFAISVYAQRYPFQQSTDTLLAYKEAVRLARDGKLDESLALMKEVFKAQPNDINVVADYIVILCRARHWEEAISIYEKNSQIKFPDYVLPEIAEAYKINGHWEKAVDLNEKFLASYPQDTRALFLKAEISEWEKKFFNALAIYDKILQKNPQNQAAKNLRIRVLMDMAANSLILSEMEENPDKFDPVLSDLAEGNRSMVRLRWNEPQEALDLIEQKITEVTQADTPGHEKEQFLLRLEADRIVALSALNKRQEVIDATEEFRKKSEKPPFWVEDAAASATLYFEQPEKALALYQSVLEAAPNNFQSQLGLYHTLVDLGRYQEARKILNQLDEKNFPRIIERGILRDNWQKADTALNQVWLLMYQDRLAQAERYVLDLLAIAPNNTNFRNALAHIYLWRGWPRLALEEFQIIEILDPSDPQTQNGKILALWANSEKEEAKNRIEPLLQQHPTEKYLQKTKRFMQLQKMTNLQVNTTLFEEYPGDSEFTLSRRLEQPLGFYNIFFAEFIRRETGREDIKDIENRVYFGDQWQPNNILKVIGGASLDYVSSNDDVDGLGKMIFTPDDYWTFDWSFDGHILSVPYRSRVEGLKAKEYSFLTTTRESDMFATQFGLSYQDYSDDNENLVYSWNTDTALKKTAYWKFFVATQFSRSSFSDTNAAYFSPDYLYNFYIIPRVEHKWFQRYEKSITDRLELGVGQEYQRHFGADNIGFIRYEQNYNFSDRLTAAIGTSYGLTNYDGADVNQFSLYSRLNVKF